MTFCEMPSIILTSDRVADACGACNLGRACGVSSFFLMRKRGESCMAKVFFSYQQQIEKLVKEKDLLIADEEYGGLACGCEGWRLCVV